jgi:tetratricopeptide (TPR) repeat protein
VPAWEKLFDLRVEDSPDPLGELTRLLLVARAYRAATAGDNFVTAGQIDSAIVAYGQAAEMLPDEATNGELVYWQGVTLADVGRVDESIPFFQRAFSNDESWIDLLWRLPGVGLISADSTTIAQIVQRAMRP